MKRRTIAGSRFHQTGCSCRICTRVGRPKGPHRADCTCAACGAKRNSEGLTVTIQFLTTPEQRHRIQQAALVMGASQSEVIRTCIDCYPLEAV